ncbi:MAG: hypothetical protein IID45_08265, partial [Planctomycetes bacterium]|nr:hypothetical protein [Planctomycetota bacterium]
MMRRIVILLFVLLSVCRSSLAADRPNFVWLLSEDNSKHFLKLFDPHGSETPRIAEKGEP